MRRFTLLVSCLLVPIACGGGSPGGSTGSSAASGEDPEAGADRAAAQASRPGQGAPGTHRVYVPAYSHIYHHVGEAVLLATTLSIRNTDPDDSLTVTSVRYYDTGGEMVGRPLGSPRTLGPLGSMEFVVEEGDVSGGSGANFIVEWRAPTAIDPPLVEAVMISTRSGQGISFTSRGVPIAGPGE